MKKSMMYPLTVFLIFQYLALFQAIFWAWDIIRVSKDAEFSDESENENCFLKTARFDGDSPRKLHILIFDFDRSKCKKLPFIWVPVDREFNLNAISVFQTEKIQFVRPVGSKKEFLGKFEAKSARDGEIFRISRSANKKLLFLGFWTPRSRLTRF